MSPQEEKVFLEVRLNNLKKYYDKVKEHAELTDLALDLKTQIKEIENQLAMT